MTTYIMRRLFHAVLVVLIVSLMVFLIMRLLPGDPILMYVTAGDLQSVSKEQIQQLRHELGMDRSLAVQYLDWLGHAVRGDLGKSLLYHYDVMQEIGKRLPVTLYLGLASFAIGCIVGPFLGVVSAVRRGKWLDSLVTVLANVGITAPSFWIGVILIYVFGLYLRLLPIYGYTSPFEDLWKNLQQSVMPILVLATFPIASAARQMRSSVIEVMQQDYIRTAWAKGLSERVVITRHVLKNALMPVVTLQGMLLRNIIGGSVVVETVFAIPGMGKLAVDGMLSQDYTIVQGVILVLAVVVVLSNLVVDMLYGWLDPRIQYE
ncbi:MAG: ABC transporter permease [Syntrophorhabdales bacterium]|jgi:peptide/nickel transport system permease protein